MGSSESKNDEDLKIEATVVREHRRQLERYEENKRQQELRRQAALAIRGQTDLRWDGLDTYFVVVSVFVLGKKITELLQSKSEELEREERKREAREVRAREQRRQSREARQRDSLTIGRQTVSTWRETRELPTRIFNLDITEEPKQRRGFVKELKPDPELIQSLLQSVGKGSWIDKVEDGQVYVLETLDSNSKEFQRQNKLFRKRNEKFFHITDIEKIFNPYLFLKFKLKEKQYQERLGIGIVQTMKMYHGTIEQNTDGICETNFDWRKYGNSTGHRFGQGVSFSPSSYYATHYGDKRSYDKVMFAVNILVGKQCLGDANTVIPDGNADTTVNDTESVYVKYEDDAFYPTYLINYHEFVPYN